MVVYEVGNYGRREGTTCGAYGRFEATVEECVVVVNVNPVLVQPNRVRMVVHPVGMRTWMSMWWTGVVMIWTCMGVTSWVRMSRSCSSC